MPNKRRFIQFPHPGPEHEPDFGEFKGWNTYDRPHARKFMEFSGEWIESDGNSKSGNLRAWGEWEAESELIHILKQPRHDTSYPRYLWHPYYVPKDGYTRLHNTDPFIFGDRFLYSNCRQKTNSGLTKLARGSVIAFGSGKAIAGKRKWVLDTVLVIAGSIDFTASQAHHVLSDYVPDAFLTVTANPIADNEGFSSFRLYRGATAKDLVDGMFSFFPAMPANGDRGFPRPVIDMESEYFNPSSWQAPKGVRIERSAQELRTIWESLATQVCDAGLVIGTRAELPEHRIA